MTRTYLPNRRRATRVALSLSCAALLIAAPAVAQEAEPAPLPALTADGVVVAATHDALRGLAIPGDEVRLSNETTVTRWVNAVNLSVLRAQPFAAARQLTRLRAVGTSRAPAIYGVLHARVDRHRRVWLQVRVPGRPNGRLGWAPATSFGALHVTRLRLVVDRRTLRATLYRGGRRIWQTRVGVGKAGTPTPAGRFFVERGEPSVLGPVYGTHVFITTAYSGLLSWPGGGAVGIHGTNQPQLVPGRPSHGCIRMRNAAVNRLARLMPVGTPLRIV